MEFIRTIRDSVGVEKAYICNGCDRVVYSLWCGRCHKCQEEERRHKELLEAVKAIVLMEGAAGE